MGTEAQLQIRRWLVSGQAAYGPTFTAMINPKSYKISRSIDLQKTDKEFQQGIGTLKLSEMIIDATGVVPPAQGMPAGVEEQLEILNGIMDMVDPGDDVVYPVVQVTWGELSYLGRAQSVTADYTLFAPDGLPLRATVGIVLSEYGPPGDSAAAAPASLGMQFQSTDAASLLDLCLQAYNSASMAASVARANGLTSLRNLPAGTPLFLPSKR
jgi:hypothetical protein